MIFKILVIAALIAAIAAFWTSIERDPFSLIKLWIGWFIGACFMGLWLLWVVAISKWAFFSLGLG